MSSLTSHLPLGILLLLGAILLLLGVVLHLEWRLSKLLRGSKATSLEPLIRDLVARSSEEATFRKKLETYLERVELRLRRSFQSAEVVRFNPFKGDGSGGNQSFTTALLSENGDGFVITGLYSRERVSVYTKPIKNFASAHELTDEEKLAISRSKETLS